MYLYGDRRLKAGLYPSSIQGPGWEDISMEELALSVLLGHGYKWVAAASRVI